MKSKSSGFTLIEMIGVMAIIAILAAITVPNMLSRIDNISGGEDAKVLASVAIDLQDYIIRNKRIPAPVSMAVVLSTASQTPITALLQNQKRRAIGYYIDPAFSADPGIAANAGAIASAVPGAAPLQFSYIQPASPPTLQPPVPRIMIISDMRTPLIPAGLTLGSANGLPLTLTQAEFDAVWNQTVVKTALTAAGSVLPNDRESNITNDPDEGMNIERISLGYLFHRLMITNLHNGGNGAGGFAYPSVQIENLLIQNIPAAVGIAAPLPPLPNAPAAVFDYYLMHGTAISLRPSGAVVGALSMRLMMNSDMAVSYAITTPEQINAAGVIITPAVFNWVAN